jgi:hypothetical protein
MYSNKAKKRSLKDNLPVLKCECGHEILILPNLKTLGKEIEEHAMEHKNKFALTQKEVDALVDSLVAQALKMAFKVESSSADINFRFKPKNPKEKRKNKYGD